MSAIGYKRPHDDMFICIEIARERNWVIITKTTPGIITELKYEHIFFGIGLENCVFTLHIHQNPDFNSMKFSREPRCIFPGKILISQEFP